MSKFFCKTNTNILSNQMTSLSALATGETLDVKPSKIVAGQEVDKTNLLLQATARGIEKKVGLLTILSKALVLVNYTLIISWAYPFANLKVY